MWILPRAVVLMSVFVVTNDRSHASGRFVVSAENQSQIITR